MKKKDVIFAVLAVVILLVAGYIAFTQLVPKKSSATKTVQVEKIGKINSELDPVGLARLTDTTKVVDFNSIPEYSNLGTPTPFGR
jgi:hypothetical protein